MTAPGPCNLITDVPGILVGNAEDMTARTGVTVVLPQMRAVAACDIRGGAPGTRETDALDPTCLVGAIDGVVLAGGSVYGLDAASAVVEALGDAGRGFPITGAPRVAPIVPAAILFDLNNGGDKSWKTGAPYRALGRAAYEAASESFRLGNAGAGLGARAGDLKGGLGSASIVTPEGLIVGALAAVNAVGSAVMPDSATLWAAPFEQDGEMGGQSMPKGPVAPGWPAAAKASPVAGGNTTIAVIATNAALTPAQAKRLAFMAQDGLARAIRPSHTPFDGDSVFVLATGAQDLGANPPFALAVLGMLAADCLTRAIGRGIYEADSLGALESYRAKHKLR